MVLTDDELLALELHRAMNAPTRSTRGKHIDGLGTKLDTGGAARRGKTPSVSFQSGPQDHGKRKSRGDADDGTTLTSSRRIKKEEVNEETSEEERVERGKHEHKQGQASKQQHPQPRGAEVYRPTSLLESTSPSSSPKLSALVSDRKAAAAAAAATAATATAAAPATAVAVAAVGRPVHSEQRATSGGQEAAGGAELMAAAAAAAEQVRQKLSRQRDVTTSESGERSVTVFHSGVRWGASLPARELDSRAALAAALSRIFDGDVPSCGTGDRLHVTVLDEAGGVGELPSLRAVRAAQDEEAWRAVMRRAVRVYVRRA